MYNTYDIYNTNFKQQYIIRSICSYICSGYHLPQMWSYLFTGTKTSYGNVGAPHRCLKSYTYGHVNCYQIVWHGLIVLFVLEEKFAQAVCFLLVDLYLLTFQPEKALHLLAVLDKLSVQGSNKNGKAEVHFRKANLTLVFTA